MSNTVKGKLEGQRVKARRKDKETVELTVSDSNGTSTILLNSTAIELLVNRLDSLFEEMEV